MSISDRKRREKAKIQRQILDTSNALFLKGGLENISIRKIADQIEYSPATIYLYFKDKEEIVNSLRDKYYNEFIKKLEEYSFIKDQFGRLKNLSNSWIDYAISHPERYSLLFKCYDQTADNRIIEYMKPIIVKSISDSHIQRMPQIEATTIVISFLHGLSYILITKKFELRTKAEAKEFAETMINRFWNSIRGGY